MVSISMNDLLIILIVSCQRFSSKLTWRANTENNVTFNKLCYDVSLFMCLRDDTCDCELHWNLQILMKSVNLLRNLWIYSEILKFLNLRTLYLINQKHMCFRPAIKYGPYLEIAITTLMCNFNMYPVTSG